MHARRGHCFPASNSNQPQAQARELQMASFVTHLESALDGTVLPADRPQTLHADRPLWVRYDLHAVGRALSRTMLAARPSTMWRYRELLPTGDGDPVSLGETMTPLLPCPRLGER